MPIKSDNDINLSGSLLKRDRQKRHILNLLYNHQALSGPSISKQLGVSLPTAIVLLNELKNANLIEVCGLGMSKGGRKPNLFCLSKKSILVLVCELGRYAGKIRIYNSHNEPVTPIVEFSTNIDDELLASKIHTNFMDLIKENGISESNVFAIGLTMPGLVDENLGINYTIKNPENRNVKEKLEEKFGKLVYINNDARMQAYGEYKFGAAKGFKNAIVINWYWGLGLGMIFEDKLYNGTTGFAGELSHTKVIEDGDLCICGKRGCLETVTSVYVLIDKARKAVKQGIVSQLTEKFKNKVDELEVEDIIKAAKSGDEFCISLLSTVGLVLGKALSNTIQLLNPGIIILGGVVSEAKQYVLTPIQQAINQNCLERISGNTRIVVSENWEQSGLLGVTAMLFKNLFSETYK